MYKPRIQTDGPSSDSTLKPAETTALTAAVEQKEHTAFLQARKLSSWCHVKHSRGETPHLSRDQVKALVQVPCLSQTAL